MEDFLSENVPPADFEKFEQKYQKYLEVGNVFQKTQFEYARCLVMSKYTEDIQKGILLLEDLAKRHVKGMMDYIYYLAVGNTKIKEYSVAIKYCKAFLEIEPENRQVRLLEEYVKAKMERETMHSIFSRVFYFGAVIGCGIAIMERIK